MGRGVLIVFEGCDKSGKSTQVQKLVETLNDNGVKAEKGRFPERSTAIGQVINSYIEKKIELHDKAVHLLFSANRWELVASMKKKLESGITLVIDRYAFSGVAFTSAKGLDFEWCKSCDSYLPTPDQVFYLDIPVDEASSRGDFGGERYEVSSFQKTVQERFKLLKDDSWQVIDARDTIENIHKKLYECTLNVINKNAEKPLKMDLFV